MPVETASEAASCAHKIIFPAPIVALSKIATWVTVLDPPVQAGKLSVAALAIVVGLVPVGALQ